MRMKLQIGVKVLIENDDGLYLLVQRSEPLSDGTGIKWDIPGGRINSNELLVDALAREVKEEVNIKLNGAVNLLDAQDIMLTELGLHVVRLTYSTKLNDSVELGTEHQSFKWVTVGDALSLKVDPYLRSVLEALHNSSKRAK